MDNHIALPERKLIKLRNGLDRYGFSYLLADIIGFNRPPRSFGTWDHGWIFWKPEAPMDLGHAESPFDMPVVVRSTQEESILRNSGFRHVFIGGLPFAYVQKSNKTRRGNSLIAFIPHSLSYLTGFRINVEYFNYLHSISAGFDEVYVCVFSDDAANQLIVSELVKRGLKIIIGAQPDDANSLIRMRWIFDQFEYVTSSAMGSHLLYAAYSGCNVSIAGPFSEESRDHIMSNPYAASHPAYVDHLLNGCSESTNRLAYPWLFVDHPRNGINMEAWAKMEIGYYSLLDDKAIVDILGWNFIGYAKGVFRGARRRFAIR